jgi:5'-methylthioadenosine phosphorylase
MKIGIITGHNIPNFLENSEKISIETFFGKIQAEIYNFGKHEIIFINRHSEKSNIPPHKINYRANIQALVSSHVEKIVSIGTVGSMKKTIKVGDIVMPHDFIDFTKSRHLSLYENSRTHVDMTNPFCPFLRKLFIDGCMNLNNIDFHKNGVYLTTEGPRLETKSEINMFSNFADIVGMTLVPEIVFSREKGICYASICIVCNMAAGLQKKLKALEIKEIYEEKKPLIKELLQFTIKSINKKIDCNCKRKISKATL